MRTTAVKSTDFSDFFRTLSAAKQRVLMLDYDGTVAPFSIALGGALHGRDCLASVDRRKHRKAAVDRLE